MDTKKRIMKKYSILMAGLCGLLFLLASCKKKDRVNPGTVHVDIGFVNSMKPEPGTTLYLNFYYADQEDTAFYEHEVGTVVQHTVTDQDTARGLTLDVAGVQASPFTYLTAFIDADGDGQLSDREIAVCYSEQSLSDVMRGNQRGRNVSGRTFLTLKMDKRYEAFRRTRFNFTFPEPPPEGTVLNLQLYYADEEEPEFYNRKADKVITDTLSAAAITGTLGLLTIVDEHPYTYANAYLDMDGNGTLNHGDMAVTYNGHSLNAVRDGEAVADNIAGLDELDMSLNEWFNDPVLDIDGNEYTTVVIGDREWMVENLRVTHYANGDPLIGGLSDAEWATTKAGAYATYPYSDGQTTAEYGLLYNAYATMDERGLAPEGWRVATDDDFKALQIQAGFTAQEVGAWGWRGTKGLVLRGTAGWALHPGTDNLGFRALPAGVRAQNGTFQGAGEQSFFWSPVLPIDPEAASTLRRLIQDNQPDAVNRNNANRHTGGSVRCVRDVE